VADQSYSIEFFEDRRKRCATKAYLDQLPEDHQAKVANIIQLLQEEGPLLRRPYADFLRDKIYELRPVFAGYQHRILYFFDHKIIVLTHGFLKKTQEVNPREIEFAIRCMNEWFAGRKSKGDSK
jgi:hypothetical protein